MNTPVMQSTLPVPLNFIDWWLAKTPHSRREFLSDAQTSPRVCENIAVLEAYCLEHAYYVYCQTTLRPRPLIHRVLQRVADSAATQSNEHTTGDDSRTPNGTHDIRVRHCVNEEASVTCDVVIPSLYPGGGVGGRYSMEQPSRSTIAQDRGNDTHHTSIGADTRVDATEAQKSDMHAVTERITQCLIDYHILGKITRTTSQDSNASTQDSQSVSSDPETHKDIYRSIASVAVQLLMEAATSAAYRTAHAQQVEEQQWKNARRQQTQTATNTAPRQARKTETTDAIRENSDTTNDESNDDDDDAHRPALTRPRRTLDLTALLHPKNKMVHENSPHMRSGVHTTKTHIVTKPLSRYQADLQSFLGIYALLEGVECPQQGKIENSACVLNTDYSDSDDDTVTDTDMDKKSDHTNVADCNPWTLLRQKRLHQLRSDHTSSGTALTIQKHKYGAEAAVSDATVKKKSLIHITASDMEHAMRKIIMDS